MKSWPLRVRPGYYEGWYYCLSRSIPLKRGIGDFQTHGKNLTVSNAPRANRHSARPVHPARHWHPAPALPRDPLRCRPHFPHSQNDAGHPRSHSLSSPNDFTGSPSHLLSPPSHACGCPTHFAHPPNYSSRPQNHSASPPTHFGSRKTDFANPPNDFCSPKNQFARRKTRETAL